MAHIGLAIALIISLTQFSELQPASAPAAQPADIAMRFVQHLAAGAYAEAHGMFEDNLQPTVKPGQLRDAWRDAASKHGDFRRFGALTVGRAGLFPQVLVPCEWQHGRTRYYSLSVPTGF